MKKRYRRKDGRWSLGLAPILHAYLVTLLLMVAIHIFARILLGAHVLKWFTLPLMPLFFTFLITVAAWLWWRKERIELMAIMGEELFYESYRLEGWLHRKRLALRAKKTAKKAKEQIDA